VFTSATTELAAATIAQATIAVKHRGLKPLKHWRFIPGLNALRFHGYSRAMVTALPPPCFYRQESMRRLVCTTAALLALAPVSARPHGQGADHVVGVTHPIFGPSVHLLDPSLYPPSDQHTRCNPQTYYVEERAS
jgi:hypothetical protein